jgi:translation initiation factor RLI1
MSFHLILMKSMRTLVDKDFELRETGQDYEDCFKQISFSTGGYTTFSNKVVEALEKAMEVEDYYYLLVYTPQEAKPDKEINIEVKVKKEQAQVIHLKRFHKEVVPPIRIMDFESAEKNIKFSLADYQRIKVDGKLAGLAEVKVTLFDENSNVAFSEAHVLSLIKEETHISIPLNQLKSGSYFLIIQAVDRITNLVDVFSRQIKL